MIKENEELSRQLSSANNQIIELQSSRTNENNLKIENITLIEQIEALKKELELNKNNEQDLMSENEKIKNSLYEEIESLKKELGSIKKTKQDSNQKVDKISNLIPKKIEQNTDIKFLNSIQSGSGLHHWSEDYRTHDNVAICEECGDIHHGEGYIKCEGCGAFALKPVKYP